MKDRVVVIGAGVGGLACAADLAVAGFDVTVVEAADVPGGKMREVVVGDRRIDSGPTVLTLRWVFEDLFAAAGARLSDHLTLEPCEVLARHAWSEGERLDLFAEVDRSAEAIGDLAGTAEAVGYRRFCADAARVYATLREVFLTSEQPGLFGLIGRIGWTEVRALTGIRPFQTLWRALGDYFADPRLRQLFGRYATYCGSSPFEAPATLMLIAHVEREGVWTVRGGMQRLAEALEALVLAAGGRLRYGARAAGILCEGGRAAGVALSDGERLAADWVVANADGASFAAGQFGPAVSAAVPAAATAQRSLSAVTYSMLAQAEGFPLVRHNVFFGSDYRAEFEAIGRGTLPADPTVYVCAQDRTEGDPVPAGRERLFMIVNAPPTGDERDLGEEELSSCEMRVTERLARCGLSLDGAPRWSRVTTPAGFERMFPATGGALYGPATHGWAAAFRRSGARTRLPGLYLAGGGAHPGAGVPMAALSGRLAARRMIADRASMSLSPRAATPGGTSTRSAPTATSASPSSPS